MLSGHGTRGGSTTSRDVLRPLSRRSSPSAAFQVARLGFSSPRYLSTCLSSLASPPLLVIPPPSRRFSPFYPNHTWCKTVNRGPRCVQLALHLGADAQKLLCTEVRMHLRCIAIAAHLPRCLARLRLRSANQPCDAIKEKIQSIQTTDHGDDTMVSACLHSTDRQGSHHSQRQRRGNRIDP